MHVSITHQLICPLQSLMCMLRKNYCANKSTLTHRRLTSRDLKTQRFYFYFLSVSCRLFLKMRSSSLFKLPFQLLFLTLLACLSFSLPFHPSIHPSLSPSLPDHCFIIGVREKRTGERKEEEERKRGRWPALYLSVFLFVCLIFFSG